MSDVEYMIEHNHVAEYCYVFIFLNTYFFLFGEIVCRLSKNIFFN